MHFAARSHSVEIMRILVEHGADAESVNEHGRRPIHEAIDSEDCVSYLMQYCKIDVNAMKRGDWTPVMIAAMKGNLDVVKILVSGGALLDRVTKDGRTALYLAVQEGHFKLSEYLADQYPEAITKATKSGRWPIQSAATLSAESTVAFNLTTYLFSKAKVSLQEMLKHRDNSGRNILLDAAIAQNLELLKFLLGKGADPNDTDSLGRSMIHHAAMMGHLYLLEIMNSLGSGHMIYWNNPDTWDQWTPLMHAAHQGELAIVQYLMEEIKVDKSCVDKQGRTA
ncbi:ankyrin, partial [Backusella circina FSU 941]